MVEGGSEPAVPLVDGGEAPLVILGLSAGFHDSAAALVIDGDVVAAVEEERLTRKKHDAAFPERAADTVLAIAGLTPADIDVVAFHEKPIDVVNRHLSSRLRGGPRGVPTLLRETPKVLREQLLTGNRIERWFRERGARPVAIHHAEHHASHAAAAFYPSPFDEAAVLTVDGVGEWATSTIGEGRQHRLRIDRELRYPDSVGLLYSAFTHYCGFRVNSGEGELMGLAPFGEPRYADRIRERLVEVFDDGSIRIDQRYFAYVNGRRMTNRAFEELFDGPARPLHSTPTQREADLAASIQQVTEEIVLNMARWAHQATGDRNLCLSGGVALNCVANGRIVRDGPFDELWVQPSPGDGGSAIGAALFTWHDVLDQPRPTRTTDGQHGSFLGPAFSRSEIEAWLAHEGIEHQVVADDDERARLVADRLAGGEVVGWFCGRMEFGPRALGHRSILADPRSPTVQRRINTLVKDRATFRPFAPAVLAHRASEYFAIRGEAPYMNITVPVSTDQWRTGDSDVDPTDLEAVVAEVRSTIPAVTHVDHSARIQTVDAARNPELERLLTAFDQRTGCPVLLNTSFNARDEPIVCTPADAHRTFRRTGLDLLVLEHCLVEKAP